MFNKVITSRQTGYKQSVGYKNQIPYHSLLAAANAPDLRENSKIIDLKKGYSKMVAICGKKTIHT